MSTSPAVPAAGADQRWGLTVQFVALTFTRTPAWCQYLVCLHGLTSREAQVLTWVAEGKTNVEVAAILGARPRTVGKHLERIYQKLGVETRAAAVKVALAG